MDTEPLSQSDIETIRKALCEADQAIRGKRLTQEQATLQQFIHGVWQLTEEIGKRMG